MSCGESADFPWVASGMASDSRTVATRSGHVARASQNVAWASARASMPRAAEYRDRDIRGHGLVANTSLGSLPVQVHHCLLARRNAQHPRTFRSRRRLRWKILLQREAGVSVNRQRPGGLGDSVAGVGRCLHIQAGRRAVILSDRVASMIQQRPARFDDSVAGSERGLHVQADRCAVMSLDLGASMVRQRLAQFGDTVAGSGRGLYEEAGGSVAEAGQRAASIDPDATMARRRPAGLERLLAGSGCCLYVQADRRAVLSFARDASMVGRQSLGPEQQSAGSEHDLHL